MTKGAESEGETMNVELLLKVKERILAEPEHFMMEAFYQIDEYGRDVEYNLCNTTACIAGWAVVLTKPLTYGRARALDAHNFEWQKAGAKALGITEEIAASLFHVSSWPERFVRQWVEAYSPEELARIAAAVIDDFIATDGWTREAAEVRA